MKGKIFNEQEVQAILVGNKTMFREVIKPQPNYQVNVDVRCGNEIIIASVDHPKEVFCLPKYPYKVGQKIFSKESFAYIQDPEDCARESEPCEIHYKADYDAQGLDKQDAKDIGVEFLPASRMPELASRLTLLIKEIKVERLQDISEEDAIAEGNYLDRCACMPRKKDKTPIDGMFKQTWCHIHGQEFKGAWNSTHKKPEEKWEANPFVWCVTFEVVK